MNPVVHFEMPAADNSRMVNFYEKAFGWKMKQLGPDMGNYVVVTTTDTDELIVQKFQALSMVAFLKNQVTTSILQL